MYAAVVLMLVALYDWWCGSGGDAAAVPAVGELAVRPPVAAAAARLVGNELGARAVRRQRAARDSAPGEPGTSVGDITKRERE